MPGEFDVDADGHDVFQAVILAGGLGTRLRSVVRDVPKPMAQVQGVPFLETLISHLAKSGFVRVVIAAGHLHEVIERHFAKQQPPLELIISVETQPLGTGGAVCKASRLLRAGKVFVINGDTFAQVDYKAMMLAYQLSGADVSIALLDVADTARYGAVSLATDGFVSGFVEKGRSGPGKINAGVYILRSRHLLDRFGESAFSFERDFLMAPDMGITVLGFPFSGRFIDIGTPDDYAQASHVLQGPGMPLCSPGDRS